MKTWFPKPCGIQKDKTQKAALLSRCLFTQLAVLVLLLPSSSGHLGVPRLETASTCNFTSLFMAIFHSYISPSWFLFVRP